MPCPDAFFNAYLEAAVWSSTDDDGEPLDRLDIDVSEETQAEMRADCDQFFDDNEHLITSENCLARIGQRFVLFPVYSQAGHDFWLTRNGHGVGFWETSDWEAEAGEQLTNASKAFGEYYLYVNPIGGGQEILGEKC